MSDKQSHSRKMKELDKAARLARAHAAGILARLQRSAQDQQATDPHEIWLKQAYVARGMGMEPKQVERLCKAKKLKTNGETRADKRISRDSVLEYCKTEGLEFVIPGS